MPPKKRAIDKAEEEKFVYVLTLKTIHHSYTQDPTVVGVYASKAAAAAAAGKIECSMGVFDTVFEDEDYEDICTIDNRKNPPDNGCLLKIGDREIGEGDYEELIIQKFPLLGEDLTGQKKKAK